MSEFDSLSDSDWLDIASRASDDNDSASSHDGLSSRPLSRRSSISFDSSHESEVEAWEGFVDESGDESALEPDMCIVRPLTLCASEPNPADTIPDISHDPADDQRVKEALDQSLVGTLSASRTSTAGHSSHNSIRDLRLSFPDPLTSSRDQLNASYQEVPESDALSTVNDADKTISLSDSVLSSSEHEPKAVAITSQGHHHGVAQQDHNNNTNIGLDIILYGSSSPIKWSFVQDLIQKAANFSGNVVLSTLDPNAGSVQTLELRCEKDNSILTTITVHDCTNDTASSAHTDDVMRASLAIVYLPAATLPVLSLHNAYLPVLVPVTPASTNQAGSVLRHAAEDDWELLGVPANRTIFLNSDKTPITNADALSRLEPWRAFEVIRNVLDSPARQIKAASDNGHPARAVTLFALVSIMMGVAFNTAFHSPVPTGPSGTARVSGVYQGNQFNRTFAVPVGTSTALATSSLKDFSLSVVSPGITSLSVNPPQVNSLSITSRINSLSVNSHPSSLSPIYTPTSLAVPGPSRLPIVASDTPQASSSKDVLLRAISPTSLSEVRPESSILSATHTEKKHVRQDFTKPNDLSLRFSDGLSEAMDIGTKIFHNAVRLESGVKDLVDAMDDLMNSIQAQTQNIVSQSKGKARALGEEVVSRNDKARGRAKELRKKGEELLNSASVQFFERTEVAKQRAKVLRDTFKKTEAWKSYERAHADIAAKLKATEQCAKDKPGWWKREGGSAWKPHQDGYWHGVPLPVY